MANIDHLVDQFVARLASTGTVRARRIDSSPWIDNFESRLGKRLPQSYRSLVTRYAFRTFDWRGISFFGNSGEQSEDGLVIASFRDRGLTEALLPAGYVQIGRPDNGDFDPICFQTALGKQNRECPIVRLNHEQILSKQRLKIREQIAPSFIALMTD